MKQTIIIFLSFILLSSVVVAQTFDNRSISELTSLKKKAVSKQDYELAAKYKRAIELKKQISTAVESEDYQKAASLKKELKALNGNAPMSKSADKSNNSKSLLSFGSQDISANTVYLHNNRTGENTELESQEAKHAVESYNAYGRAIKGYYSTVQLTNKDDFTFIIKLGSGVDPTSVVSLVKLDLFGKEKLNRRQLSSETTSTAYAGIYTKNGLNTIVPIYFKSAGNDIYEIVVNKMILPGEYAFKFGMKWYLFGAKNRISNNPGFPVVKFTYSIYDFYHLPADAPNISWLGIDCSIFQLRSDYNVGKDNEIKTVLLGGMDYNRDNYMNQGKLESWLEKKHRIDFQVAFGYDWTLRKLAAKWIIPRNQEPNVVTEEDIAQHIKEYEINNSGMGMVLIPVLTDRVTHKVHSYMVVFDFDTREILEIQKLTTKMATEKIPKDSYFAKEFLYATKLYVDRYFKIRM